MTRFGFFGKLHCRWCGSPYKPKIPRDRDGFCKNAHKQALYRAHKKYVTAKARGQANPRGGRVTRKKRKICPLCNKPTLRVKDNIVHLLYIHKESVKGKGGRACIVPTPKKK